MIGKLRCWKKMSPKKWRYHNISYIPSSPSQCGFDLIWSKSSDFSGVEAHSFAWLEMVEVFLSTPRQNLWYSE
jgi:hypothetical protein